MSKLFLVLWLVVVATAAGGELEPPLRAKIDEIYGKGLYDPAPPMVRWIDDRSRYTRRETDKTGAPIVVSYRPDDEGREIVFSLAELEAKINAVEPVRTINGFAVSSDLKNVLAGGDFRNVGEQRVLDLWLFQCADKSVKKIARDVSLADPATAFSPDGRWIVFGRAHDLYVYDIGRGVTRRLTRDGIVGRIGNGIADDSYSFVRWSPDSTRIAFLQTDSSGVGLFPLIDNTTAAEPKVHYQRYAKVGASIPLQRLGAVNVRGGPVHWINVQAKPGTFFLNLPRWTSDGKDLVVEVVTRARNAVTLLIADAATGKSRVMRREQSDTWVRDSGFAREGSFNWIDEGKESYVWLAEIDGWRRAYAISGDVLTPITPADVDVIGNVTADRASGWLYYAASPENATQRYLFRARLDGSGRPERVTPDNQPGTHFYDIAPNNNWAFHTFSNADTPPVTELIALPSHKRVRVIEDNAKLTERMSGWGPRPTEFFQIDIGDGIAMDAWMLKPRDFDERKKYPVFVFIYGEPASQAVVDAWSNGQGNGVFHRAIADAGYLVVAIDNRGTPAPKGAAWRRVVFGSLGLLSTEEQAAGLRELGQARAYVDLSRVAIWGWSAGGTNTLNALFRKPDQYHVGIAVAAKPKPELYNGPFQENYMRTPDINPVGYRNAAAYNFAEGLKGDLLIIHGTGEYNTHLQIIELLVNRMIELNKPFDYMTYPGRGHGINEGAGTTLHLRMLIARYLIEHLPAGGR